MLLYGLGRFPISAISHIWLFVNAATETEKEIPQFFQHLVFLPLNLPEDADSFYLKLKIKSVLQADQREVLKALAEIANCGDYCCGH